MIRAQLEHIIRAAVAVADDDEIIVVGSQAVLGQFPDAPAPLLVAAGLASPETLLGRLASLPVDEAARSRIERAIAADARATK